MNNDDVKMLDKREKVTASTFTTYSLLNIKNY